MAAFTNQEDMKKDSEIDITEYPSFKLQIYEEIDKLLKKPDRFESITTRKEESVFDAELIDKVSKGKYKTRWRGVCMMKDCFDMVIYEQLLWEIKPRTIFEIGTYTGACAMWMADTMATYKLPVTVHSIDVNVKLVDALLSEMENVKIAEGDAKKIGNAYPESLLQMCAHPWVITEDCHVNVLGVMEHFHKYMKKGDYFIIEDTSIYCPVAIGGGVLDVKYEMWGDSKLKLMKSFLRKYEEYYQVDTFYTDYFGYNGTLNWDGYIKRTKD